MNPRRAFYIPVIVIVSALFVSACSTEKNTFFTRAFHNITAHYNVYFNGAQSYKKGVKKVREDIADDYTTLLPVFKATKSNVPSAVAAQMDKAIKKSVKLIKTHSITVKPKRKGDGLLTKIDPLEDYLDERREEFRDRSEYCNWVDDAYLLMGKAHYYKHDYSGAINSLKILERSHKYSGLQPRGWLWQARSYIEMGYYDDAKINLDKLNKEEELPRELKVEYSLALASLHINRENYNKALIHLKEAVDNIRRGRNKARYHYLMAQIAERIGKSATALDYYARVIDENPVYEMAFNAKINQALAYQGGRSGAIKEDLQKMIKDEKNKEYLGRIYYALANIYQKEGNTEQALNYYKKAASKSQKGSAQVGLIYLKLGDMYYDKQAYQTSAAYYDSTMTYISDEHPNYEEIEQKATSLIRLAQNMKVAKREDSLQRVAQMPEKEQMRLINKLIDEEKRRQQRAKKAGQSQQQGQFLQDEMGQVRPGQQSSGNTFYFNNQSMIGRGITRFEQKWGRRKLEDHWRRRNKSQDASAFGDDMTGENAKPEEKLAPEYYKKNLPVNDSMMQASQKRRRTALYEAGMIYKNQVEDLDAAQKVFKEVVSDYKGTSYELEALYELYRIADMRGNNSRKSRLKQRIVNKYPQSQYARILSDPDYLKRQKAQQDTIEALYQRAFNRYSNARYTSTLNAISKAENKYGESRMMVRFLILKAMTQAELGNPQRYSAVLERIIRDYPNAEERKVAEEKLKALEKTRQKIAHQQKQLYRQGEGQHYLAVTFSPDNANANQLRFDLLSFNLDFYEQKDMQIQITDLFGGQKILLVKSLQNLSGAANYYTSLKERAQKYLKAADRYELFLITPDNLKTLQEDKNLQRYLEFFQKNYNL